MVTKSKLKMALAAEKGTDFKKLTLKRRQKAAAKAGLDADRRGASGKDVESSADEEEVEEEVEEVEDDDDEDDEDDEENEVRLCLGIKRLCR